MAFLRTLNADGTLVVSGQDYGPADYQLDAYQDHRGKWADGVLNASPDALAAAFRAPASAIVRLSSVTEVELVVTKLTMGSGQAQVKSSGPVPGL